MKTFLILLLVSLSCFAQDMQSKELLGSKNFKKLVTKKTVKNSSKYILTLLEKKLPAKYKKEAKLIHATIIKNANKYKLDPMFVAAIISGESSFNPEAVGPVQEIGLMQLRPHVAKWITEDYLHKKYKPSMLTNPYNNIRIGTRYLAWLRTKFDKSSNYIAAYNMGPKNVKIALKKKVSPKDYPRHVMKRYLAFYKEVK